MGGVEERVGVTFSLHPRQAEAWKRSAACSRPSTHAPRRPDLEVRVRVQGLLLNMMAEGRGFRAEGLACAWTAELDHLNDSKRSLHRNSGEG